jgi:hypothetical protein
MPLTRRAQVLAGTVIQTQHGQLLEYRGFGPKTRESSYIDVTSPELRWSAIEEKPNFGSAALKNAPAKGNAKVDEVVLGGDKRLKEVRRLTSGVAELVTRADTLEAEIASASGRIETIEEVYVSEQEVASSISEAITAEITNRNTAISAAVTIEADARVAADATIQAHWGVSIDVNGRIVGRVKLDGTGETSEFGVLASKFTVQDAATGVVPFQIVGTKARFTSDVEIDGSLIVSGTLSLTTLTNRSLANLDSSAANKLAGIDSGADVTLSAISGGLTIYSGGVTLAGTSQIKSSNYSAGSAGWAIKPDGSVDFNNGTFRGAITSTSGTIGGFTLGAASLSASFASGSITLSASGFFSTSDGTSSAVLNQSGLGFVNNGASAASIGSTGSSGSGYVYVRDAGGSATVTLTGSTGLVSAVAFSGEGTYLTALNASNISTGTIGIDRLPATGGGGTKVLRVGAYSAGSLAPGSGNYLQVQDANGVTLNILCQ